MTTTTTTKGGVNNKTTSTNAVAISDVLDRLDRSNQTLFNILLPVFGAWVGVVVAFYFGSEQAKRARDALTAQAKALSGADQGLANNTVEQALISIPVPEKLIR